MMISNFFFLICFLVGLIYTSPILAYQIDFRELEEIITSQKDHPFNGVILLAQEEEILFEHAYGFTNYETQELLTPQNYFFIGSLSKQMTAVLIQQEVERGHIDLTVPIATYLPEVNKDWAEITVHHLLTHSSGIKEGGKPLISKPGETFFYSNIGYDLLGSILERATEKAFSELSAALFQNCSMKHTVAPLTESKMALHTLYKDLAVGYTKDENSFYRTMDKRDVHNNPSGGIISTLHDLHYWTLCLHGGKILTSSTYAKMITP
jgi:CubicO group peptidase (beta-lactamase class C family)